MSHLRDLDFDRANRPTQGAKEISIAEVPPLNDQSLDKQCSKANVVTNFPERPWSNATATDDIDFETTL